MTAEDLLARLLLLLGAGFLVANVQVAWRLARWYRMRARAVLTWPSGRPPFFGLSLGLGLTLGLLALFKAAQLQPPREFFGELMMFFYYGYGVPFSMKIRRGLYEDGILTDTGFVPYTHVAGLTWVDGARGAATLVVAVRDRATARSLAVPGAAIGEVRRVLREKVAASHIDFVGAALDLGGHDARDDI